MLVKDLMTKEVITVNENDSYDEVVHKLVDNKITGAPVVDSSGFLVGIVTEFDLSHILFALHGALDEGFHKDGDQSKDKESKIKESINQDISDFIIKDVHTVDPNDTIMEAGRIMLASDIDRMPVVEGDKIVGIIGRRKLFRQIFKQNLNF